MNKKIIGIFILTLFLSLSIFGNAALITNANPEKSEISIFSFSEVYTDDQSPSTPIITGPCEAKLDQICNYTIVSIDPQDDDIFYEIRYSDAPNLIIEDGPYLSGISITVSHYWWTYYQNSNPFCIRVRARDIDGHTSDWSICKTNITDLVKIKTKTYLERMQLLLENFLQHFAILLKISNQITYPL